MKYCNICKKNYYDESLEFCLDDGSRLVKIDSGNNEVLTAPAIKPSSESATAETVEFKNQPVFQKSALPETDRQILQTIAVKKEALKKNVTVTSHKFLEISPIILALAHNYWQWLYLFRQPTNTLSAFFSSFNFLIWILLLISGLIFGIFSLKYSEKKGFAITALVVLAINLILSIVPK